VLPLPPVWFLSDHHNPHVRLVTAPPHGAASRGTALFAAVEPRSAVPTPRTPSSRAESCNIGTSLKDYAIARGYDSGAPRHFGNCKIFRHQFVTIGRPRGAGVSAGSQIATGPGAAATSAVLAAGDTGGFADPADIAVVSNDLRSRVVVAGIGAWRVSRCGHGGSGFWSPSDVGVHYIPPKRCFAGPRRLYRPTMRPWPTHRPTMHPRRGVPRVRNMRHAD
jgi:hypothetical protein